MAIPDADFLALNLANRGSALEYAPNYPLLLPRQAMLAKNPAIREVTCRLAITSLQKSSVGHYDSRELLFLFEGRSKPLMGWAANTTFQYNFIEPGIGIHEG